MAVTAIAKGAKSDDFIIPAFGATNQNSDKCLINSMTSGAQESVVLYGESTQCAKLGGG
jgi:hypothetical protein